MRCSLMLGDVRKINPCFFIGESLVKGGLIMLTVLAYTPTPRRVQYLHPWSQCSATT